MRYTVSCPACGSRAPWTLLKQPVLVRCVEPQLTRQLRRQAEREHVSPLMLAPICGEVFRVLPVAA